MRQGDHPRQDVENATNAFAGTENLAVRFVVV
jgi:hypothetical protein